MTTLTRRDVDKAQGGAIEPVTDPYDPASPDFESRNQLAKQWGMFGKAQFTFFTLGSPPE